jgi:hypothetical protein
MNEKVENLMLEHLRVWVNDVCKNRDDTSTFKVEMVSVGQHMASILTQRTHDDGDIGSIKLRLDGNDTRLGLAGHVS